MSAKISPILFALMMAVMTSTLSIGAHHSLSAEFNTDKTVTLTGTVVEMRWSNPHAWLYVEVKDDKGQVVKWAVEFGSPNSLYRRGWRREDLPAQVTVTVNGYPSRDNSQRISATDVKLPDGRTLFAGTAPEETR